MDWGLGNPNKTATVIAMLMIAVWTLAYIRRWGFLAALILFTGLGVCLIHTFSRGGVVALLCGLGVVVWKSPRPWPLAKIVGAIVSLGVFVSSSLYFQAHHRFGQGVAKEDRSITNRLRIWQQVPTMMVDAPTGWGKNQAPRAFMQWYQRVDAPETYLNLVNSHFTWMVEVNWVWRFCYLFGWGLVFVLCWPVNGLSWLAIPFGVWIAFGVGCTFTHVAESYWSWIVPGLGLLVVLGVRTWHHTWLRPKALATVAGTAAVLLTLIYVIGSLSSTMPIRGSGKKVVVGRGDPKVWIVADPVILGNDYGKTLRRFLQAETGRLLPTVAVVRSMGDIACSDGCTLVVAGSLPDADLRALEARLLNSPQTFLLNPTFYPQEVGANGSARFENVATFFGEFSQSPAFSAWNAHATVRLVEVAGNFLPRWPELIFPPTS